MSSKILLLLAPIVSLALTGCVASVERQVVWAEMGTPARIVDQRPIRIVLPDGQGGWLPGSGTLAGMVAIDEPTLQYYQTLDQQATSQSATGAER